MLREPGSPTRRGSGTVKGRIIGRFGDRPIDEVTTREVSAFLRDLDAEGMSANNVNEHRGLLHAVFVYAMKPDTYELTSNPVTHTDKRYEPPPPPLDFYEAEELEALAQAAERGEHRGKEPNYRGRPNELSYEERAVRAAEDRQDAELFRLAFYSGMRLGELIALRWRFVLFAPDLSGAIINVVWAVSAGRRRSPRGVATARSPFRTLPAEALARLGQRGEFVDAEDYVFCNRLGERLDPSAIGRRYRRAITAADLRKLKFHGLRHANGSVLARSLPLPTVPRPPRARTAPARPTATCTARSTCRRSARSTPRTASTSCHSRSRRDRESALTKARLDLSAQEPHGPTQPRTGKFAAARQLYTVDFAAPALWLPPLRSSRLHGSTVASAADRRSVGRLSTERAWRRLRVPVPSTPQGLRDGPRHGNRGRQPPKVGARTLATDRRTLRL